MINTGKNPYKVNCQYSSVKTATKDTQIINITVVATDLKIL